jgi:DNA-binding GntR family transcriptional regulator
MMHHNTDHGCDGIAGGVMKEISKDSLGHTIYGRVCQDLICGKLRPNQKITIRGLADALGTSSTPVRDAVQRLLQDNALEQRSVRDVRVPVMTMPQYLEIAVVRAELEGLAAAKAAEVAHGKDVARLKRIIARNEEAIAAERWPLATEMNQKFHFALAEIADMPILLELSLVADGAVARGLLRQRARGHGAATSCHRGCLPEPRCSIGPRRYARRYRRSKGGNYWIY